MPPQPKKLYLYYHLECSFAGIDRLTSTPLPTPLYFRMSAPSHMDEYYNIMYSHRTNPKAVINFYCSISLSLSLSLSLLSLPPSSSLSSRSSHHVSSSSKSSIPCLKSVSCLYNSMDRFPLHASLSLLLPSFTSVFPDRLPLLPPLPP